MFGVFKKKLVGPFEKFCSRIDLKRLDGTLSISEDMRFSALLALLIMYNANRFMSNIESEKWGAKFLKNCNRDIFLFEICAFYHNYIASWYSGSNTYDVLLRFDVEMEEIYCKKIDNSGHLIISFFSKNSYPSDDSYAAFWKRSMTYGMTTGKEAAEQFLITIMSLNGINEPIVNLNRKISLDLVENTFLRMHVHVHVSTMLPALCEAADNLIQADLKDEL